MRKGCCDHDHLGHSKAPADQGRLQDPAPLHEEHPGVGRSKGRKGVHQLGTMRETYGAVIIVRGR